MPLNIVIGCGSDHESCANAKHHSKSNFDSIDLYDKSAIFKQDFTEPLKEHIPKGIYDFVFFENMTDDIFIDVQNRISKLYKPKEQTFENIHNLLSKNGVCLLTCGVLRFGQMEINLREFFNSQGFDVYENRSPQRFEINLLLAETGTDLATVKLNEEANFFLRKEKFIDENNNLSTLKQIKSSKLTNAYFFCNKESSKAKTDENGYEATVVEKKSNLSYRR